ncbi:MAG: hypothetical protein MUF34_35785 [Polyangiaceae bacterium]|nr:hypothetical protein [Polyangiaceae bacterium]
MSEGVAHEVYQRELDKRRALSNAALLRALHSDDANDRWYAFLVLIEGVPHSGAFGRRRPWGADDLQGARRELLAALADATSAPLVRAQALYALSRLGLHDAELLRAVQGAFDAPFVELRTEAVRAFPEDGDFAAAQLGAYIIAALDDPSHDVQWSAVHRLGELPQVASTVAARLFAFMGAEDTVALAAAYTLKSLVESEALSKAEVVARVEARPLTTSAIFLVSSLLDAASDEFVARAVLGGPAVARIALTKIAETSPESLARALGMLHERDPSGFAALLDQALAEDDDDDRALARGSEELWAEALRPQLEVAKPAQRAAIDALLARWSG